MRGNIEELQLDLDEASYIEITDELKIKGYIEYCFYFSDPDNGLVRLHSDDSSRRVGDIYQNHGSVFVHVEYEAWITREYVSFEAWSSLNIDSHSNLYESCDEELDEGLEDLSDFDDNVELQLTRKQINQQKPTTKRTRIEG
ncbi:hypothetical protein ACFE04_000757 [Oxalis oulophora]